MTLQIDAGLVAIAALGAVAFEDVVVREADARLDGPLAEAEARARASPPADASAVRAMYRRTGVDPTRTRPSSEALLRRVRRGDRLPRINTLVDVCNWCSLDLQLPYGLYDLAPIEPPIELRLGRPGEQYAGIRKDTVHLQGRLTLADRVGPFGNPTSDSARTMVTTRTSRALAVVFCPRAGAAALPRALEVTAGRMLAYAGGRESIRLVV